MAKKEKSTSRSKTSSKGATRSKASRNTQMEAAGERTNTTIGSSKNATGSRNKSYSNRNCK